jgi:hypothetical protein
VISSTAVVPDAEPGSRVKSRLSLQAENVALLQHENVIP